jgi:DNA repair protein RecO
VPTVRDEAICVRHWDWSETSQTVSLLTREHGLVRGLAKGSRREKGAFSGGVELLTLGEVLALSKPRTELLTLTAWDLRDPFTGLRRDLRAFHAGMYLADLVLGLFSDHDPHPAAFEAIGSALGDLASAGAGRALAIVLGAQWAILSEAGMKPELAVDVRTGAPLTGDGVYAFVPGHGGFTRETDSGWRVRGETVALLRGLGAARGLSDPPGGDPASVERAVRLLAAYVEHQVGRASGTFAPLLRAVRGGSGRD